MWAVLLQVVAVAAGWQIIRQLPWTWRRGEALAASVAVGYSLAAWLYFAVALAAGWAVALPMVSILLAGATVLSWWKLPRRAQLTSTSYVPVAGWQRWIVRVSVLGGVAAVSHLVFLSYQFPAADGSWLSNGNVWGDGPLHVTLVNQFAHGQQLDLVSPVYKQVLLTYPLIADFWSGVLMRLTSSWHIGLMLPSLVMILALMQLLFSFGYRLLGSARAAWLAWLMIVFSGSLRGGFQLTQTLLTKGLEGYHAKVGTSIPFATGDNYLNFFHSHPLPQRAYLFGMALLLVVLTGLVELYRRHRQQKHEQWRLAAVLTGVCGGLLPLVHTHSFMVLAGLLGLATIGLWLKHRRWPAGWWLMLGIMAALAAPQIIWQFTSTFHSGFSRWTWGWMMTNFEPTPHDFWPRFWLWNVGWLFVMIVAGWYWLRQLRAQAEIWLVYLAGVAIFVIANVYIFQPSYWDNMKFFEYAFWLIMLASGWVLAAWSRKRPGAIVVAGIMASLTVMGFYTLVLSGPKLTFQLLSPTDVKFGETLRNELPASSYVLVGDRHNHPVTMLAGAKVLMTFGGWYNLYDGNWIQTLQDRGTMLTGEAGAAGLIQQYGLAYAVFSDAEVMNGEANLQFYQDNYKLVMYEYGWWVYSLREGSR